MERRQRDRSARRRVREEHVAWLELDYEWRVEGVQCARVSYFYSAGGPLVGCHRWDMRDVTGPSRAGVYCVCRAGVAAQALARLPDRASPGPPPTVPCRIWAERKNLAFEQAAVPRAF